MIYKVLFFIALLFSFISCYRSKNISNNDNRPIENNNVLQDSDDEDIENILNFVRHHINEGYYLRVETGNVVSITKKENKIIIQNYNRINNEDHYEEIVAFDILHENIRHEKHIMSYKTEEKIIYTTKNDQIYNEIRLETEGRRWVSGSGNFVNGDYAIYKIMRNNYPFIHFIKKDEYNHDLYEIKGEDVIKRTYDHQKQYTGVYKLDTYTFYGMDEEEFDKVLISVGNNFIVDIDDDGFLYIADEEGNEEYPDFGGKVIDENDETLLFGHSPAYGFVIKIYYFSGTLNYKMDFDDGSGYHIIYRK